MTDYHSGQSLKEHVAHASRPIDLPAEDLPVAEQIVALETWLRDHADRPRVARVLRADDRVRAERRLADLRSQLDTADPEVAASA